MFFPLSLSDTFRRTSESVDFFDESLSGPTRTGLYTSADDDGHSTVGRTPRQGWSSGDPIFIYRYNSTRTKDGHDTIRLVVYLVIVHVVARPVRLSSLTPLTPTHYS